jgi:hypothetical protein
VPWIKNTRLALDCRLKVKLCSYLSFFSIYNAWVHTYLVHSFWTLAQFQEVTSTNSRLQRQAWLIGDRWFSGRISWYSRQQRISIVHSLVE